MKHVFTIVTLAVLVFSPALTKALTPPLRGTAWTCAYEFEAVGSDIQVRVGLSKLKGAGEISCVDGHGNRSTRPANIRIETPVLLPRSSVPPTVFVQGRAVGIVVPRGDSDIIGTYDTVDAQMGFGSGSHSYLSLLSQSSSLSMTLDLIGAEGFGIAVGGTSVTIEF